MIGTTRRERVTALVGGSLIVAMLIIARGVPWWREWQGDALSNAAEVLAEVARAEASVQALEGTLDSLEAMRVRFQDLAPILVGVGSVEASAGALSLLVSGASGSAGVNMSSIRVGSDTSETTGIRRVWASADLEGDTRGIVTLIAKLEGGSRLITIREIAISQPDPGAPSDRAEALSVRLRVEGLALVPDTILGTQP